MTIDNIKEFRWSKQRLEVAKEMAEGIKTQKQIAEEFNLTETTISLWKRHPDFLAKIDEYTLDHERATRAGLIREALYGLNIKKGNIELDTARHLDYVKELRELQGITKQNIDHSGTIGHTGDISLDIALQEYKDVIKKLTVEDKTDE